MSWFEAPIRHRVVSALCVFGAAATFASCGTGSGTDGPTVVSTAPQIDVLLHSLAGDGIEVGEVVAATQDIHDIELRPSQVRALKDADIILRPGRDGDAWAQEALRESDAKQIDVAAGIAGNERHWWMDPTAAISAADAIVPHLDKLDPDGATARAEALEDVRKALKDVDAATVKCLDTIPANRRVVVTDHEAIGSFAERYGLTVAATVAPGRDPEASPSAQRVVELLATIERRGVSAIFPIAPHGGELSATLARRAGIALGRPLWADALPNKGHAEIAGDDHDDRGAVADAHVADDGLSAGQEPAAALVDAAFENASAVAEALGADPATCGSIMTG